MELCRTNSGIATAAGTDRASDSAAGTPGSETIIDTMDTAHELGLHIPTPHCFMGAVLAEEWAGRGQGGAGGGGGHVLAAVITGVRKHLNVDSSADQYSSKQQKGAQQKQRQSRPQWCVHLEWRCSSSAVLETIDSDFRAWFDSMFQGTLTLLSTKRHTSRASVMSLPAAIAGINRPVMRKRHGGENAGEEQEEGAATATSEGALFDAAIPARGKGSISTSPVYGSEGARLYGLRMWERLQSERQLQLQLPPKTGF